MSRRLRREQARKAARQILKNPPKEDLTLPSNIFKALKKELNRTKRNVIVKEPEPYNGIKDFIEQVEEYKKVVNGRREEKGT